jgi:ribonuclease HI
MENEDRYHAVMTCTVAKALRHEARKVWKLPLETELTNTGKDWVTVLLDKIDDESKTKIMFIWWRAWHHRNNMIFDTGKASITHSVRFISNYFDSMQAIKNGTLNTVSKHKGQMYVIKTSSEDKVATTTLQRWKRPQQGWTKINFDASFIEDKSKGAWGAVARANDGSVLFSAWDIIPQCQSAEMAEAIACLESLKVAVKCTLGNLLFETDCNSLLKIFDPGVQDRSASSFIAKEFHLFSSLSELSPQYGCGYCS